MKRHRVRKGKSAVSKDGHAQRRRQGGGKGAETPTTVARRAVGPGGAAKIAQTARKKGTNPTSPSSQHQGEGRGDGRKKTRMEPMRAGQGKKVRKLSHEL